MLFRSDDYNKFLKDYSSIGYKAWIIPADDIRDKPALNRDFKSGLLDSKNIIKPEYNNEELKQMLDEMIQFSAHHR